MLDNDVLKGTQSTEKDLLQGLCKPVNKYVWGVSVVQRAKSFSYTSEGWCKVFIYALINAFGPILLGSSSVSWVSCFL